MSEVKPRRGPGAFQWNAGGWYGALCGSTGFLILGAVLMIGKSPLLSGIWCACFTVALASGITIWRRRESLAPYPAIQMLLFVVGIVSATALLSALFTRPDLLEKVNLTSGQAILMLLLIPLLMLWFHVMERLSRRPTEHRPQGLAAPDHRFEESPKNY